MRGSTVYTLVSAFYYQQMPVLHTRMETHALITQMLLQIFHQHIGFFGRNMSRRMVLDSISFNADNITAHRHFTRLQVYTDTCRFQRAASLIYFRQVIAQNGHIGNLTAGMKSVGNSF